MKLLENIKDLKTTGLGIFFLVLLYVYTNNEEVEFNFWYAVILGVIGCGLVLAPKSATTAIKSALNSGAKWLRSKSS